MGMDLKPMRPTKDAPKRADGSPEWGRYSWSGWRCLIDFLYDKDVELSGFDGSNDGKLIKSATCKLVAKIIEDNVAEYALAFGATDLSDICWALHDAKLWKTCGGYRQY